MIKNHSLKTILAITFYLVISGGFYIINSANAEMLDIWDDERAYRPAPVLFLHGFGLDSPQMWTGEGEPSADDIDVRLQPYFGKYYTGYREDPTILEDTDFPYLEVIDFIGRNYAGTPDEILRQELIDRNSSIDRYQSGDYYVSTGERNIGDPGWSDKVGDEVQLILNGYGTDKVILVCYSMGGLAAREYFRAFNGDDNAIRLITIATPHLGSVWATTPRFIRRTQTIGWFIPFSGWRFSYTVEVADRAIEHWGLVDTDGDAVRDMIPGSDFLTILNNSFQPQDVDYFAIAGDVRWYSGDGVVSLRSARGEGALNLKDEAIVSSSHGNVPQVASEGDPSPLLRFIDSTKPVVEITLPDPNASPITEIHTPTITVEGTIDKEYLPADTDFTVNVVRDDDGVVVFEKLYFQRVRPFANSGPKPAGFNEEDVDLEDSEELLKEGTYTISVVATNPAGISSDEATTQVNVVLNKPVITDVSPVGDITNKTPIIQARIYSPDNFDIDLSSIEMKLDGLTMAHTVTPETGGPDVTISYTPINNLDFGSHAVVVNASDKYGFMAEEKLWSFAIQGQEPRVTEMSPVRIAPNVFPINIQARVYSPDGIDIDLSSVEMYVNDVKVTPTISPPAGGPDITVSYSLTGGFEAGKRIKIKLFAKDIYGASTDRIWDFYIFKKARPDEIWWYKVRVDSNTSIYKYPYSDYQAVASPGIYPPYEGVDVYAVTYVKFDMSKFIASGMIYPQMYLLWHSYQDYPVGAPITVTVYENTGSTDLGATISLGTAYDSQVLNETRIYYFDITNLWNAWITGEKQNRGLILKVTSGSNRSIASYGSREDTRVVDSPIVIGSGAFSIKALPFKQQNSKEVYPPIF